MWRKRRSPAAETRSLLAKLRARAWKSDAEREAILAGLDKAAEIGPEDVAWMASDADGAVRKKGLELLARFPLDDAAEAIFPELASRSEPVRKAAMQALETLAGPSFSAKMEAWIEHRDPAVVHAALDYARRNPSERVLPGVARALGATSPSVRRKAFAIVESLAATVPRAAALAARALEDDDEELRYRAITVLARNPTDSAVAALLKRCHNESPRVQEAAVTALTPLLTKPGAPFHPEILPLLSDGHTKVRQLAVRILAGASARDRGSGFPPGVSRRLRDRARSEHPGDLRPRTDLRPGAHRAGPQPRPGDRVARGGDRRRDPVPGGRAQLHAVPGRRRLLAARAGGAASGGD